MAFMAMTWRAQGLPDEGPILRLARCGARRSRDPQQVIAKAFINAIPRTERSGVLSFMAPGNGLPPPRGLRNPSLKAGGGVRGALGDPIPIAPQARSIPISRHRYGSGIVGDVDAIERTPVRTGRPVDRLGRVSASPSRQHPQEDGVSPPARDGFFPPAS